MSPTRLARLAGVLYLILGVAGGFAQLVARAGMRVADNPGATADNIRASSIVVSLGFAADAVNILFFVLTALVLYVLLSPVSRWASVTFATFAAIAAAIMGSALAAHAGALVLATDPAYAVSFGATTADALAALFLDLHGYGYLVAEIFFGLWLAPLGYAVYRSGWFPRWLGVLLVVGAGSYVASFISTVLTQGFAESDLALVLAMPAALAEVSFILWLLIRGVRIDPRSEASRRVSPAAASA